MGNYNGMYVIEAGDVVSGKMATAFIKHEGKNIPCSWFLAVEAVMTKKKNEAPRLGTTSLMNRAMGWSGSGTCKMYYATSLLRSLAAKYANEGKDTFVEMVVSNEDPSTMLGAQTVILKNVNFNRIPVTKFDAEVEDPLCEEVPFTFDGFELISSFTHPAIPAE